MSLDMLFSSSEVQCSGGELCIETLMIFPQSLPVSAPWPTASCICA